MGKKGKFYIKPETYSVLLSSTESQKAAKLRHALKESYGVPEMFKEFGHVLGKKYQEVEHGVGKAYSEMSYKEKVVYGLALFALLGVVADTVANEGKYTTKPVKDKLDKVYEKVVKKTPAVVIGADTLAKALAPTPAPTPAYTPNGSAAKVNSNPNSHEFTPDIKVYGSDAFKTRVQNSLEELNKTPDSFRINGMTAYEYATYYLDELHEGADEKIIDVGIRQYPIDLIDASNLIHIPRHIEQGSNKTLLANMEKWRHKGEAGGLFNEHDAIKLQVAWEKARYNLTDEQASNSFLTKMKYYTKDSKYFEDTLSVN